MHCAEWQSLQRNAWLELNSGSVERQTYVTCTQDWSCTGKKCTYLLHISMVLSAWSFNVTLVLDVHKLSLDVETQKKLWAVDGTRTPNASQTLQPSSHHNSDDRPRLFTVFIHGNESNRRSQTVRVSQVLVEPQVASCQFPVECFCTTSTTNLHC